METTSWLPALAGEPAAAAADEDDGGAGGGADAGAPEALGGGAAYDSKQMGQFNKDSKSTPAAGEKPEPAASRARRLPAAAPNARGGGETSPPARSITAPASDRGMTSAVRSTTGIADV